MKPIFSDDPQAIEKLQAKIEYLENMQKHMKHCNSNYKKYGMEWAIKNISADTLRCYSSDMAYSWNKGKIYPGWALTNNSATIRTAKKRLAQLINNKNVSE